MLDWPFRYNLKVNGNNLFRAGDTQALMSCPMIGLAFNFTLSGDAILMNDSGFVDMQRKCSHLLQTFRYKLQPIYNFGYRL